MSRLHCARYVIPLHRPWWSTAWRALQRRWLQHRLDCVVDEFEENKAVAALPGSNLKLGEQYVANCTEQIADLRQRLALLEVHS